MQSPFGPARKHRRNHLPRLIDRLPLAPPVTPLHYHYNIGRRYVPGGVYDYENPANEADDNYMGVVHETLVGRALQFPKFAADAVAKFVFETMNVPFWDLAGNCPALVLPAEYFWVEFKCPDCKRSQTPALNLSDYPADWGWACELHEHTAFAALWRANEQAPPACDRGLVCHLACRYVKVKNKDFVVMPMTTVLVPLDARGRVSAHVGQVSSFLVTPERVFSEELFASFVESMLHPLIATLAVWPFLRSELVEPSAALLARHAAKGKPGPYAYTSLDASEAIEALRYVHKAGIVGLPAAMKSLSQFADRASRIIITGN